MVRARTVARGAVALAVVAATGLALPPLWLALDESATPPVSALTALPDGARVVTDAVGCASGGCWRELTVDAPAGMSGEELVAEVVPDGRVCGFQGVFDLRRVCLWAMDTEAGSVDLAMQYERWVN